MAEDFAVRFESVTKVYRKGMVLPSLRELAAAAPRGPQALRRAFERPELVHALREVSFTLAPGRTLGIVGRNGAGKSTILKIIAGITDPTSGRAEVRGRVGALIEIGSGFHPELSGRDNIFYYGTILGMNRREIRGKFDRIVEYSEIDPGFLETPVKKYSSGMYLRLAFSVAVAVEPEVLLLDEVLAVGDLRFRMKCYRTVHDIARSGRTAVVMVSHAMEAIHAVCEDALWLDEGRVRTAGKAPEVTERYREFMYGGDGAPEEGTEPAPAAAGAIRRVRFLDGAGREVDRAHSGQPLAVEVEVLADRPVLRPVLGVVFYAAGSDYTAKFFSSERGTPLPPAEGAARYRLTVPAFAVPAGRYAVSVLLGEDDEHHLVDWHDRRYRLLVLEPPGSRSPVGMPHGWERVAGPGGA